MQEMMKLYVISMNLTSGLNEHLVFEAWDKVTGAGSMTLNKYLRDGVLYCTISSSVARNQLYFQRKLIVERINNELKDNPLFFQKDREVGFIKSVILK